MHNRYSIEGQNCRINAGVNNGRGAIAIDGVIGGFDGITAANVRTVIESLGDVSDIDLTINSPGGSIGDGVAIYNMFKKHPANIHVSIEGYALSMGSVIAMAGDTVSMADNSLFMIHNTMGGAFGDADTLRKEAEVLDKHKEALIASYLAREQITLDRDELWQAMQDETWYTAEEARAAGFVDDIIESDDLVNNHILQLPVAVFKNAPEWVQMIRNTAENRANAYTPVGGNNEENDMPEVTKPAEDQTPGEEVTNNARADALRDQIENARLAERKRITDIRAEFDGRMPGHAMHATVNHHIEAGTPLEQVKDIVNALVAAGAGASPATADIEVVADSRDKLREGMTNALLMKAGMVQRDHSNEFVHLTLYEMVNASLRESGIRTTGGKRERVGAAFTHSSSDLPATLYDVAHKSLQLGYAEDEDAMTNHTKISRKGQMSDFRPHERHGRGGFDNLDLRPEGSEYKRDTLEFYKETNRLATYGKMFGMTREMIINDDLGAFTDVPAEFGRAARRTVVSKFWDVFAENPVMADGVQWIHATHENLNATGMPLTTDTVDSIRTTMSQLKGRNRDKADMMPMGIRPNVLVVPAALMGRAMLVQNNEYQVHANATDENRNYNVVRNTFEVVANPALDAISTKDYYMVYNGMPPIEVSYLDGVETPFLDQTQGWEIDGVEYKVRIDVGISPMEFASIYKQTGV